MYRIDKFLQYYDSLGRNNVSCQIDQDVWVHALPLPFYYGFFTKEYWIERKQRIEDARAVRNGRAVAVTWDNDVNNNTASLLIENEKLKDVISSLLDGLDSNRDHERCGLTEDEWEKRVKEARDILK